MLTPPNASAASTSRAFMLIGFADPTGLREAFADVFRRQPLRYAWYDPIRPEPEQRNRLVEAHDLMKPGELEQSVHLRAPAVAVRLARASASLACCSATGPRCSPGSAAFTPASCRCASAGCSRGSRRRCSGASRSNAGSAGRRAAGARRGVSTMWVRPRSCSPARTASSRPTLSGPVLLDTRRADIAGRSRARSRSIQSGTAVGPELRGTERSRSCHYACAAVPSSGSQSSVPARARRESPPRSPPPRRAGSFTPGRRESCARAARRCEPDDRRRPRCQPSHDRSISALFARTETTPTELVAAALLA